ncbi:hypothetical protein ERJ75_000730500 [Trypanosoma vivax]|uniref:Uncharacterized protein n=1 Tax=Trypanosoma vivax (strain Y486) TaxID=1055687 RepID=G0TX61_TRYVY|nr:hypothetical protein ERJ75_000730500 [Trypanosoma vivax]CCC48551.1 conserved hypothetical protein [Trypanosoma vivax Y486]
MMEFGLEAGARGDVASCLWGASAVRGAISPDSDSEDDLFCTGNIEEHYLVPAAYFTEQDIPVPTLEGMTISTPSSNTPAATDADGSRLHGPGVLRGVRIPSPKEKRGRRAKAASHNGKGVSNSNESKKNMKQSLVQSLASKQNKGVKRNSALRDKDDADYRR